MKSILKKRKEVDIARLISLFNCTRLFNKSHARNLMLQEILRKTSGVLVLVREEVGDVLLGFFSTENQPVSSLGANSSQIAMKGNYLQIKTPIRYGEMFRLVYNDDEMLYSEPSQEYWRISEAIPVQKIISVSEKKSPGFTDLILTISP